MIYLDGTAVRNNILWRKELEGPVIALAQYNALGGSQRPPILEVRVSVMWAISSTTS